MMKRDTDMMKKSSQIADGKCHGVSKNLKHTLLCLL